MADTLADPELWLPSEFLADDEILMGKENINGNRSDDLCFPSEFPYEFGSSSTESESDEEDLAGLARKFSLSSLQAPLKISYSPSNLEKKRVFSGSPQSTLSTVGSWSVSPPTTPFVQIDDAWDLIYAAAGQVARMKMNMNMNMNMNGDASNKNVGFCLPLKYPHHCLSHSNHFQQVRPEPVMKQHGGSIWGKQEREEEWYSQQQICQNRGVRTGIVGSGGVCGRPLGLPQSAWPPLQVQNQRRPNHHQHNNGPVMKSVFLTGSGGGGCGAVKRECAGTGVFLPRRYCNPSESRKKPPTAARVVQALNKNYDPMIAQAQAQAQSNFSGGFLPHYDAVMARRNALLAQQRISIRAEGAMNHHHPQLLLPHEWTY